MEVRSPNDLDEVFEDVTRARADALVLMPASRLGVKRERHRVATDFRPSGRVAVRMAGSEPEAQLSIERERLAHIANEKGGDEALTEVRHRISLVEMVAKCE